MITVARKVGRLVEIRMTAPITAEDVASLQRDMSALERAAQGRLVVCADLSGGTVLPDDLADQISKVFREGHVRLERTAIVVGDGATLFLQIDRVLREGAAPPSPVPRDASARDASSPRPKSDPHMSKRLGTDPHMAKRMGSDPHMAKRVAERRAFRVPTEAMTWLDELLTSDERARIRMFLEGPH